MKEWEELTKYSKQFHMIAYLILSRICYGIPNTYVTRSFYAYNTFLAYWLSSFNQQVLLVLRQSCLFSLTHV